MRSGAATEPAILPPIALLILFPLSVFVLCCYCYHGSSTLPGVTAIWAVDESEKVRQDGLDHWAEGNRLAFSRGKKCTVICIKAHQCGGIESLM